MSKFIIPKGKAFEFNVIVKDTESFLPKDLTAVDTAELSIVNPADDTTILTVTGVVVDAANGAIQYSLSVDDTSVLDKSVKGSEVDWYYTKPRYKANILITFTDDDSDMLVMIDKVYVV
jgi:hypothetical protein